LETSASLGGFYGILWPPEPKPLSAACQLFWAMAIAHWQRYSGILPAFVSIAGLQLAVVA